MAQLALRSSSAAAIIAGPRHFQRAGRSSRRMDLAAAAAGDCVTRMSLSRAGRSSWRTWAGATSHYAD